MSQAEILKMIPAELSKDYIDKRFKPLLEADISGYLYHLWASKLNIADKLRFVNRCLGSKLRKNKVNIPIVDVTVDRKPGVKEQHNRIQERKR